MIKKGFCGFIKYYFDYTNNKLYDNNKSNIIYRDIKRKERLFVVIVSYVLLIISCSSLFFSEMASNGYYLFSIIGIAVSGLMLLLCRFSFTYYLLIYRRFLLSNNSINNKVIVDECIYLQPNRDVRKVILDRYKIIDVKGSVFSVKYYIIDKAKNNKNFKNKHFVLKITPTKIFINGKIIFSEKLLDLSDLADYISIN